MHSKRHLTPLALFVSHGCAFQFTQVDRRWHRHVSERRATSDWVDITEKTDGGVLLKEKSFAGANLFLEEHDFLSLQYTGTIAPSTWTVDETIVCWLNEQQGLSDLADAFREHAIDEEKLLNEELFNEAVVTNELGVSAKIKAKKLVMAAKRLSKVRKQFTPGLEFDYKDSFEVPVCGSKLIQGMSRGLAYMVKAKVVHAEILCRSDYAYGAEGYRKVNGDVLVPPFASLRFDVKILSSH
jgi:hypothetical protein